MKESSPLITYVLLTRNRADTLLRTLARVAGVSRGFSSETIVIDNASEDATCALVRKNFPGVRLFRNAVNLGAEARNTGIFEGRGKYVFMLDDDSYPLDGAAALGLARMEREPRAGCLAYRIAMSGGRRWTNGLYTSYAGCGALFRRKALLEIGGYPAGYGYYVEEYDVSFRLLAAGWRLLNFKDLLVYHEQAAAGRNTGRIIGLLAQNNVKLYSRFFPPALAADQIRHELERYEVIAKKEGVMDAYLAGVEASFRRLKESALEKRVLREKVCRRLLGLDEAGRRVPAFLRKTGSRRPLLWSAGKAVHHLADLVNGCGGRAAAIADDNARFYGGPVRGAEVVPPSRLGRLRFDSVICGSSSLSVNDDVELRVKRSAAARKVPFLRLCDYDAPGGKA